MSYPGMNPNEKPNAGYNPAGPNQMYQPPGQPNQMYQPPGQPVGFQPGYIGGPGDQSGYQPQQPPMQHGAYVPPGYQPVPNQSIQPTVFGGGMSGGGYAPAITNQPQMMNVAGGGDGGWMNIPQGIPHCPPGLEYLTTIDQLLVKQKVEVLEAFTGFETNNKYTIKNSIGQKVYWAVEDNDCCTRNCCGPSRPFDMKIMDTFRNTVIHLHRPLACSSCCFPCCLQNIEVSSPPGTVVGTVQQEWSLIYPTFAIKNASGDTVLRIEGPLCTSFMCCGDIEFKITTIDGTQVGKISKQWSGLAREFFTDADFFGINFPMDLDVKMKAVMLGACFLIDYMYFEKANNE